MCRPSEKVLYQGIARRLSDKPRLRPQAICISMVGLHSEDWSLGNGETQLA